MRLRPTVQECHAAISDAAKPSNLSLSPFFPVNLCNLSNPWIKPRKTWGIR